MNTTIAQLNHPNLDQRSWHPERGEVYLVDLGRNLDSEQNGIRPAIIVSNGVGNKYSSIVQIIPITSQRKRGLPTHVRLTSCDGMKQDSIACAEQTRTISKQRAFFSGYPVKVAQLKDNKMQEIDSALKVSFGLM